MMSQAPADPKFLKAALKSLKVVKDEQQLQPLKKRILEAIRIHDNVGFNGSLQQDFVDNGGVKVLIDIIVTEWPPGSRFDASSSESGKYQSTEKGHSMGWEVQVLFQADGRKLPFHKRYRHVTQLPTAAYAVG